MEDRLDLSLKPSLSSYTFRPQQEPPSTQIHEVEDEGALLAMVESQAAVAISKMKASEPRMAVSILRRAYDMVESSAKSHADVVPPSTLLAAASARLFLCVVLSSIGKHGQALTEARASAREMDKVWRSLFLASAEQEIATKDGDITKPAAPLRTALRTTPSWLQRAVEVAIQARHCIALELEFVDNNDLNQLNSAQSSITLPSDESIWKAGNAESDFDPSSSKDADSQSMENLPLQKQIEMLHKEGVELATQLLPAGHPVRVRAEQAFEQWKERSGEECSPQTLRRAQSSRHMLTKLLARSQPGSPAPAPPLPLVQPAASPQTSFAQRSAQWSENSISSSSGIGNSWGSCTDAEFPWILHKQRLKRLPPRSGQLQSDAFEDSFSTSKGMSSSSAGGSNSRVTPPTDKKAQTWSPGLMQAAKPSYARAPPGDVYVSSLSRRRHLPQLQSAASAPSLGEGNSADGGTTKGGQSANLSSQQPPAPAQKIKDPFEDWRRNMLNPNQMSYFLRQLKTDEGLNQLQGDLAREGNRFKNLWLKDLDPDQLFQNRTLFSSAGLAATQRATKKMDDWKKKNWEPVGDAEKKTQAANPELYSYFGVDCPKSAPDMSSLGKLLKASQTHGVNLDKEMRIGLRKKEQERQILMAKLRGEPPPDFSERKPPPPSQPSAEEQLKTAMLDSFAQMKK